MRKLSTLMGFPININNLTNGDVMYFNGTEWINIPKNMLGIYTDKGSPSKKDFEDVAPFSFGGFQVGFDNNILKTNMVLGIGKVISQIGPISSIYDNYEKYAIYPFHKYTNKELAFTPSNFIDVPQQCIDKNLTMVVTYGEYYDLADAAINSVGMLNRVLIGVSSIT